MKKIKLIKTLMITTGLTVLAIVPTVVISGGCSTIKPVRKYLPDGSNWVGRTAGTLNYTTNEISHTYTITGNNNFFADSTFTIPNAVMIKGKSYAVTTIGEYAFGGCAGLAGVNLGNVTTIGDDAFDECILGEINIGNANTTFKLVGTTTNGFIQKKTDTITLTSICGACGGIACGNIVIPSNVTVIDNYTFYSCKGLANIDLANVTAIGTMAFEGCEGLTSVDFANVTTIATMAFNECTLLANVNFAKVTTIGEYAFNGCVCLTSTDFASVITIGNYAFDDCTSLATIDLKNVTTIGNYAFYECAALANVNFANVTTIGEYAFYGCSLEEINIDGANTAFELVGTSTNGFIKKKTDRTTLTPICGTYGGIACGNITIPSDVTTIDAGAFAECAGLTNVNLANVTTISSNAFAWCTSLASVNLTNITAIGDSAFFSCFNLSSVTISSTVYPSSGDGWYQVGPDTGCMLYAPTQVAADAFKTNVIKPAYAAKWTYQQISQYFSI